MALSNYLLTLCLLCLFFIIPCGIGNPTTLSTLSSQGCDKVKLYNLAHFRQVDYTFEYSDTAITHREGSSVSITCLEHRWPGIVKAFDRVRSYPTLAVLRA